VRVRKNSKVARAQPVAGCDSLKRGIDITITRKKDQTPGKLHRWCKQGSNKEDFPVGPTGFGGSRKFGDVMTRIACSEWYLEGRFDEIEGKGHPRSV
jgi:hypothetical protein